jgi:hypothetical protein
MLKKIIKEVDACLCPCKTYRKCAPKKARIGWNMVKLRTKIIEKTVDARCVLVLNVEQIGPQLGRVG